MKNNCTKSRKIEDGTEIFSINYEKLCELSINSWTSH